MNDARKSRLRRLWFQLHKWLGILLAIIFIPLCLTGSLLVWDDQIDRALQPAHYHVAGSASLPASAYVAAATAALPTGKIISGVTFAPAAPVVLTASDPAPPAGHALRGPPVRISVWLDPTSARVIDKGPSIAPLLRWAHMFHGNLQIPGSGRAIVGWLGVAMLLSSLTGIWLWWPLTGSVARGFRWRRRNELEANLHHLAGFWISVPLAILSLTGVIIAWPQMIGSQTNPMHRTGGGAPLAATRLTPDQAIAAARVAAPFTLTWPTDQDASWRIVPKAGKPVTIADADDSDDHPRHLDHARGGAQGKHGGQGKSRARNEAGPGGPHTRPLYRSLHDGTGMGLIWQLIITLAGLAPTILGVTGIIMWLRTRRWRNAAARKLAAR